MFRPIINTVSYTIVTLFLVVGSQAGRADDTEIYFSGGSSSAASSATIRPNVLFILDTSGSMDDPLSGDPDGRSRIEVLRESMASIISNIQNVNLGLMRFTYNEGGPVLFPITYIDEPLENVVGEVIDDSTTVEVSYERLASEDAEEDIEPTSATQGQVTTDNVDGFTISSTAYQAATVVAGASTDLELQLANRYRDAEEDLSDSTNNMSGNNFGSTDTVLRVDPSSMVALRYSFAPGTISKCSDITDANLKLRVHDNDSGTQVIKVWAQDSDSTDYLYETHQGLSSRPDTSAVVLWDPPAFGNNAVDKWTTLDTGSYASSTRLEDVIEEVINRGCSAIGATDGTWDEQSLVIFMAQYSGSNDRDFYAYDESSWRAPRLLITTTETGVSTPEVPATKHLVAVRFEDVDIPADATITTASLHFQPSIDAGTNNDNTWRIYGEKVADSPPFSGADSSLSTRFATNPTTNYAQWSVPAWQENVEVQTTNSNAANTLVKVLDEITDSGNGWCGGNAITLFIEAENDDALRYAESLENTNDAFKLDFTFESGASNGCFAADSYKQLEVSQDDAQQNGTNALADVNETTIPIAAQTSGFRFADITVPNGATIISAQIEFTSPSATTGSTDVTITGELPSDGDADEFQYALDNISKRLTDTTPTSSITWSLPATLAADEKFTTPVELKDIVKEIVDDANWASGQAMAFVLQPVTSGDHAVYARDGDATKAAKLTITYESSGATITKTARQRMIELVEQLPASDHTPILDVLYEAAHYWRGESVEFGKYRQGADESYLSHPGSYCSKNADGTYDCHGATIDASTDDFGVDYESGCDPATEWESNACDDTYIKGSPDYISPFSSSSTCQKNYQIFLTDGELYDRSGESATEIASEYTGSCLANNSSFKSASEASLTYEDSLYNGFYPTNGVQKCAVDLVKFLNETDQVDNTILENKQTVQTSTVAFDLTGSSAQYMKDIANLGGGKFYEANSATQLTNIFESFLQNVRNVPTSFVAPSLATNAFNRLLSRDEVYFGLFTPELDKRWNGNIKKYNICVDTSAFGGCSLGEIIDADQDSAINPTTFRFDDGARSIWTDPALEDSGKTVKGGAGAEITDYSGSDGVTIYTEVGGNSATGTLITSGTTLNTAGYVYKESTTASNDWAADDLQAVRAKVCNPAPPTPVDVNHADAPDCKARMLWLLGKKTFTDPESDVNTDQRWTIADVLHSSPIVITYGGADTSSPTDGTIDVFYDKLLYGTNDGALHMLNGSDGSEDWRFIPNELMLQQRDMFDNPEGDHVYGMDVTPNIYVVDHNNNGVIEIPDSNGDNDIVYAYMGMRRGGNLLYALDLSAEMSTATTSITPKFLWRIKGGTTGFERLSQTWSRPQLATIDTASGPLDVLIFGGGYDDRLDDAASFGTAATSGDNMGNAIYIINAVTGAKILSISGDCSSCSDIEVTNMHYAIPSRITIQDSDRNGIDDRLYVGDTGGQVWRVDLGNDILAAGGITAAATCEGDSTCNKTVVGRLASISNAASVADQRRFFEPPSVVQVLDTEFASGLGGEYDYVLMGTGYRAHPLNEDVEDRFYAFRDTHINGMTAKTGSNLAANYPKTPASGDEGIPIGHSIPNELVNITTRTLEDAVAASVNVDDALGWFFDFNQSNTDASSIVTEPGEKVLSAPITIAGTVFFTTFVPTEDSSASGDTCAVPQIGSGRAYNLDILTTKATVDWQGDNNDITGRTKTLGGGIPSDVVPVFTKEGVVGIVGVEGGATQLGGLAGLPRFRTYWYEESGS